MKAIDFHPDAEAEARAAANWYAAIRESLGEDFREELRTALERIQTNPQMFAVESGNLRTAPLQRFPYSVIYEELGDRIWVAAVGHHSRQPGFWSRRRAD